MFAATAGVVWFVPQGKGPDGDGLRDSLRLWAEVHRGNKDGTEDVLEGAPGSHKKRGDREISNHRARLV